MKLHLSLKIISAFIVVGGVYYLVLRDEAPSVPRSFEKVAAGPGSQIVFDPENVKSLSWVHLGKEISWPGPSADPFSVGRRLELLSKIADGAEVSIPQPLGTVKLELKDGSSLEGAYNADFFGWMSGPFKGRGFALTEAGSIKDIFNEGAEGLKSHILKVCSEDQLSAVELEKNQKIVKEKDRWIIWLDGKPIGPADREGVKNWLARICHITVSFFSPTEKALKYENPVLTIKFKNGGNAVFERQGDFFLTSPESRFKSELFKSDDLKEAIEPALNLIIDPAFGAARAVLDTHKSQDERLNAIRAIKKLKSVDGIPALKKIIFENTQIDIYRYEAVDALAAIGTKEAFQIIADRLAQVSRSGYQLRLARALAAAMGEPFTSDENTADSIRQPEVQDLLKEFRKQNPGK